MKIHASVFAEKKNGSISLVEEVKKELEKITIIKENGNEVPRNGYLELQLSRKIEGRVEQFSPFKVDKLHE